MKTIDEIQNEIINEFKNIGDWLDIYEYLIKLGLSSKPSETTFKEDCNLLPGCQNKVWIVGNKDENGFLNYSFASDALIVTGIIALIMRVVSGQKPEDILKSDLYFIEQIGLKDQISYSRGNGLKIIIEKIYDIAQKAV